MNVKKESFFILVLSFAVTGLAFDFNYDIDNWQFYVIILIGLVIGKKSYKLCKDDEE